MGKAMKPGMTVQQHIENAILFHDSVEGLFRVCQNVCRGYGKSSPAAKMLMGITSMRGRLSKVQNELDILWHKGLSDADYKKHGSVYYNTVSLQGYFVPQDERVKQ